MKATMSSSTTTSADADKPAEKHLDDAEKHYSERAPRSKFDDDADAELDADADAEFGGTEARRRLERKLVWKIDLRMSVLVFIYILNYVRRTMERGVLIADIM